MLQSWRWFGPSDPISLREIRQAGITGIVTALHYVPCGQLWALDEIEKWRDLVASSLTEIGKTIPIAAIPGRGA